MKRASLLVFSILLFAFQNLCAQRIIWSESYNNRIRSAELHPTSVQNVSTFISGLDNPGAVVVDQINGLLYYQDFGGEDIIMANLYTGAPAGVLVSSGAMAGYNDIAFSDNAGAIFAAGIEEIEGVDRIPTDGGPHSTLNLGPYSYDVFSSIAVDDDNEYIYITHAYDGTLHRTGFGGNFIEELGQLSFVTDMFFDRLNNDLYLIDEASSYYLVRYDLDGGGLEYLFSLGSNAVTSVRAYPQFGKVYYAVANTGIYAANIDGTGTPSLILSLAGVGDINFDIVEDWQLPAVYALSPLNNATNVSTTPELSLTFDETINISNTAGPANQLNIRIYRTSDDALIHTIERTSGTITVNDNVATMSGIDMLSSGESYYVLVGNRVFSDLSGNNFAGIASSTVWRFETIPGVVITAPEDEVCTGSYSTLGDIIIREGNVANFKTGVNRTIVFALSTTGYSFRTGVGEVSHTNGSNITASSISVTSTAVTVTYSVSAETQIDQLVISGVQITSDNSLNPDATVIRSAGTGVIDGLAVNTVVATVASLVSPSAPAITYPAGQVFCIDSDVSGVLVSATGTSLKWYSDEDLLNEITTLSASATGTGTDLSISSVASQEFARYVTQTSGGCESAPAKATIKIDAGPQGIETGSTPNTVCSGTPDGAAEITDVNNEGLDDYTVSWYDNEFTPLGATGPALSGVPAGEYNALVTSNITGCSNYAATITVTNDLEIPVVVTSSISNTHCVTPNGAVTASIQSPAGPSSDYQYTWYNGPDTDSDILAGTGAGRTGLAAAQYTVIARYIPTGCTSAAATVNVDNNLSYPAIINPSGDVCETAFESGSANVDLTSYNATVTGSDADLTVTWFDGSSNPVTSATVSTGAVYTFAVTSLSTGCQAAGTLEFTVFTQPTPAVAGDDQTVCGSTTTLEGNQPVYGIGNWTVLSGTGGTFDDAYDANTDFHGTAGNTYQLQWETFHVGQCPGSTSTVEITFAAPPSTADAGSAQTVCDVPAALAANTPTVGTGTWTIISGTGGSFDDIHDPSTSFTGTPGNVYELRWTIANGSCPESSAEVTIIVTPPPTAANAGADISSCGNSVTLDANTPTIGTGAWSVIAGTGGLFASASNPSSSFTGTAGGSYTLRWTISNPGCLSVWDDVIVQFVNAPSTAVAGSNQEVCASTVALAANTPSSGTGTWSVVSGTGGTFDNTSAPNASFTGTPGFTYTLRWTITSGADCPVSTDDVTITLVAPPTPANAGDDMTICNSSVTLAGNTPAVGSGQWTVVNGVGGSFTNASTAASGFSGTGDTSYQIRWTTSNGICPPSSDDVIVTLITPPTVAQAGPDQYVCSSNAILAANAPTSGTGRWSIVSGSGGTITSPANPSSSFTGATGTTYTLRWTIEKDGCSASADDVVITLQSAPQGTAVIAGADPLCEGESADLVATGITGADTFNWTAPSGITLTGNGAPSVSIAGVSAPGGTITVTPANQCGNGATASIQITILESPEVNINLPASPYPEEAVQFSFTSNTNPQQIAWGFGDGASSNEHSPSYAYGSEGDYTITLTIAGANGCEGSASQTLTVKGEPDLDDMAIKNVITANGDDKNRYLHILNIDRYPENEVRFLDRWGVEVFRAENYGNNWDARGRDGQFLPAGQYICVVRLPQSGKVVSRTVSIIKGR